MNDRHDIEALKELLPFYINGTLDGADRADLESALAVSSDLRIALEEEREMQSVFNSAMEATMSKANEVQDAEVQPLLDADESETEPGNGRFAKALSFLNPANWSPAVTLAIAAAAIGQTAALAAQSGTIKEQNLHIAQLEADNFALASGNKDCNSQAAIIIELNDNANWGEISELFNSESLTIKSSNAQGVLMLEYDGEASTLDSVIERLEASDYILSASKVA